MSIRRRLTLLYTSLMALALLLFSLVLFGVLRWTFVQAVDTTLQQVADRVAHYFDRNGRLPPVAGLGDRSTFVQVRVGERVVTQSDNFSGQFPLPPDALQGRAVTMEEKDSKGEEYRLYTLPIFVQGRPPIYVQVAHTMQLLDTASVRLRFPLAVGAALVLALGALGASLVAKKAIAPIDEVARAAQSIGNSADLTLRVPYDGPEDEVGLLVQMFNQMLDQLQALYGRLAASVDAQQRFVADASHELRTPLTIIRGNIEYLQKAGRPDAEALADMASEAERMTRLVEELLSMARADAGQSPQLKPILLGPLLAEACRKGQALPREVEFQIQLPEALDRIQVIGDSEWLVRAILILLDNAFKYTASGSVTVRAGRQGEGVVIQVMDTGAGISPEELPYVFERFYRADPSRTRGGSGLGLAIARWVVGVHGGKISAESEPGAGSTFSLWLPVQKS